jgi:DNA ligase-1
VFSKIEDTTKRLEITKILEDFFRDVIELTPEDLKASVYLACNKLAPQFENIELGIGDSFLIKAITTSTGRSKKRVKSDYEKSGDLGIVAEQSRSAQKTLFKPKPLTIRGVYKVFRKIAHISGNKSQAKKVSEITRLLAACSKQEARFLIRGLQGKLRIGLASQTVNVALATAMTPRNTKKEKVEEAVEIFKKVMSECPSYVLSLSFIHSSYFYEHSSLQIRSSHSSFAESRYLGTRETLSSCGGNTRTSHACETHKRCIGDLYEICEQGLYL